MRGFLARLQQIRRPSALTGPYAAVNARRLAFNRLVDLAGAPGMEDAAQARLAPTTLPGIQARRRRHDRECRELLAELRRRPLAIPDIYELGIENPRGRLMDLQAQGHRIVQDEFGRQVLAGVDSGGR